MYVLFRTDASHQIGTGHVMRCLTLAESLRSMGAVCHFVCRSHAGHLVELIRQSGFKVSELHTDFVGLDQAARGDEALPAHSAWLGCNWQDDAEQTLHVLEGIKPDWLVIDHYALDARWESMVRPYTNQIMVIDDLADRNHDCDFLLDQNWFGSETDIRYCGLVPDNCKLLLGPEYALLRPEYSFLRQLLPPRDGEVRRVLVFLGGGDPTNETGKVLEALEAESFKDLVVDVVVGVNHPDKEGIAKKVATRTSTYLHSGLSTLSGLMARADLMVSAGGSTSWERMCLGLPGIVISIAANQMATNNAMQAAGYIDFLGESESVSAKMISDAISQSIREPERLKQMSRMCQAVVPGDGVAKACDLMLKRIGRKGQGLDLLSADLERYSGERYVIQILTDAGSWIAPYVEELAEAWIQAGHNVRVAFGVEDALPGDFCFCLSFSCIVSLEARKKYRHTLVVHESDLPAGKGWAPMSWQILEGKDRIPVTLIEAVDAVDAGPIYLQEWICLNGTELNQEWRLLQARATQKLCTEWLKGYPEIISKARPQTGDGSYYARRRPEDSRLDASRSLAEQFNLLRVVDNENYPAFFEMNGKNYEISIVHKETGDKS